MKNTLLLLCLLMLPVTLAAADGKQPPAKAPAQQRASSSGLTLPEAATELEANTYRYTDPQSKTWIYRRTPFGLTRYEDRPAASSPVKVPEGMKALEDGDNVRFECPSPFGVRRWVRKKTDLSDVEREAWNQARESKAAGAKSGTE